jgi:hypothetical protein
MRLTCARRSSCRARRSLCTMVIPSGRLPWNTDLLSFPEFTGNTVASFALVRYTYFASSSFWRFSISPAPNNYRCKCTPLIYLKIGHHLCCFCSVALQFCTDCALLNCQSPYTTLLSIIQPLCCIRLCSCSNIFN